MKKSDYTDYFENVSSKLANTTYRRGISEETLKRFELVTTPNGFIRRRKRSDL